MKTRFTAIKSLLVLVAALSVGAIAAPQAHAGVGKVAGSYKGGGTFVDHRQPTFTYTYTFSNMLVTVKSNGKLGGSSDVSLTYTVDGVPSPVPQTSSVTVTGKAKVVKTTSSSITATGSVTLSDGTTLDGTFTVNAKSGKGKFKVKFSDAQFDANFALKKK